MFAVSRERWQAGIDLEREEWATLAWQRLSKNQQRHEWERHLASLGLSLSSFIGQSILDVGCGPTGVVYFVEAVRRVGLDPLGDQYAQWNGHWGAAIELVKGDGEAMPFPDEAFDAVFCVNALDHTRDPSRVVEEIARVLRPGGTVVLHVDLDSPLRRLHKLVRRHAGLMHPHSLSHNWLRSRLEGFEIKVEKRDEVVFRPTLAQMRYEAFWDGLMYRLTRGSDTWINHVWLRAERGAKAAN